MSNTQEDSNTTHKKKLLYNPLAILRKHDWAPHLFHESIRPILKKSIVTGVLSLVFTTVMTMLGISLLFGSSWNPAGYLFQVPVVIINHDASIVGNFIQNALTTSSTFAWVVDPSIIDAQDYVNNAHAWAAVYIPSSYSQVLNSSLQSPVTYNNTIQVIYDQGRANAGATLIFNALNAKVVAIAQQFATLKFAEYAPIALANKADPRTVVSPVLISVVNLHPVARAGEETACTLMFVIVFIICTAIIGGVRQTWTPFVTKIKPYQLTMLRVTHNVVQTFVISLLISLLGLAFGAEYAHGFVPYWMIVW
jgi:hypothetical protein